LNSSVATFTNCTFTGNEAQGGSGNFGGGNLFVGVAVGGAIDLAQGGVAGAGGILGQGIGGGVYLSSDGVVCFDLFTSVSITGNTASTSNNDVFGDFTICP
jgi:hypothetical protein